MSRRLMLRNTAGGGILPPEYQQVEWIQADAQGAHINTLLIPSTANKVVVKGKYFKSAWSGREEVIVHARFSSDTQTAIEIGFSATQNRFINYSGSTSAAIIDSRIYGVVSFDAAVLFSSKYKSIELDSGGTALTGSSATANIRPTSPFLIYDPRFAFFDGRVYGISFEFDDVPAGDFVPCYRKADGTIGMYDTVSGSFFMNAGTGTFSKGADI